MPSPSFSIIEEQPVGALRPTVIKPPHELHRELLGVIGLLPFLRSDSSSRVQMFSSHIGQALVLTGSTERFIQTGMEREYAKYTFSVKMPVDAHIIRVIDRYRSKMGAAEFPMSPQTVVIYEDVETKEVGMLDLGHYCSHHQYFGFRYKATEHLMNLAPGAYIAKDTVLLDSPSVTPTRDYKFGTELNFAFMSVPGVAEDGVVISEAVLERLSFYTYEVRTVEWGNKRFPLNLYPDPNKPGDYKPFPGIGQAVRDDGMLMALRNYDKRFAIVQEESSRLRTPNEFFDKITYAPTGGTVVDIRVQHKRNGQPPVSLGHMDWEPEKYDTARRQFYQDLLIEYNRLKKDRNDALRLTPDLHNLIVTSLAVMDNSSTERIDMLYRKAPLDEWRMEFVIEYKITPTIGFKLTDLHGGKGVICKILPADEMPMDAAGNRADIVMDPNSTVSRMNYGRLYEQYINAAGRDVVKKICADLQLDPTDSMLRSKLATVEQSQPQIFKRAWDYLLGFYKIISPQKMYVWLSDGEYKAPRHQHLYEAIHNSLVDVYLPRTLTDGTVVTEKKKQVQGLQLYFPPDNDPELLDIVHALEQNYRPTYGPVTYVGNSGKRVTTKTNVRIGSMYVLLLEKIGDDWTAVSSAKVQHHGVLAQTTNSDKYSQPTRVQPIRTWGEAEFRIGVSYVGPYFVAEVIDRNNNPLTHKEIVQNLLRHARPSAIVQAVERDPAKGGIVLGAAKPLQLVKHILECSGIRFIYQAYTAPWVNRIPVNEVTYKQRA